MRRLRYSNLLCAPVCVDYRGGSSRPLLLNLWCWWAHRLLLTGGSRWRVLVCLGCVARATLEVTLVGRFFSEWSASSNGKTIRCRWNEQLLVLCLYLPVVQLANGVIRRAERALLSRLSNWSFEWGMELLKRGLLRQNEVGLYRGTMMGVEHVFWSKYFPTKRTTLNWESTHHRSGSILVYSNSPRVRMW